MAGEAQGAIAEVGNGSQRASVAADACDAVDSCDLAFPANVAQDSLLVCGGIVSGNTSVPDLTNAGVTDTRSTSYDVKSAVIVDAVGLFRVFQARGIAPSAAANTVTVNPSGTADFIYYSCDEFSAVDTTTPDDADGSFTRGQSTTASDGITTGVADALIIGVLGLDTNTATTIDPPADYTQIGEHEACLDGCYSLVFKIVTTAQAYTVGDWALSSTRDWAVYTRSFKPAGAAAAGACGRLMLLDLGGC